MKMIVISDNQFFRVAFNQIKNYCQTVIPEAIISIGESGNDKLFYDAVVIISVIDREVMIKIVDKLLNMNTRSIFIEPSLCLGHARIFYTCNIYILPCRMRLENFITIIRNCMLSSVDIFRINMGKVKGSEWIAMLYLMSGISNRRLALMINVSEKAISSRIKSLACKTGLAGLNKPAQLYGMYIFYLIHTLRKTGGERYYFEMQHSLISDIIKGWSVTTSGLWFHFDHDYTYLSKGLEFVKV